MGQKRKHQVTRTILKNFPKEAAELFEEGGAKAHSQEEDISNASVNEGSGLVEDGIPSESGNDTDSDNDGGEFGSDDEVDFDQSSGTDDDDEADEDVDILENDSLGENDKDSALEDDEFSKKPKKKVKQVDHSFGQALSSILKQKLPKLAVNDEGTAPILAKRKAIERGIEEAKLEAKARTVLRRQRQASKDSARVIIPDTTTANFEKLLRKSATKGVVQLFNAIQQHQINKEKLAKEKATASDGKRSSEVAKEIKQISKSSFLEMLKGGASTIASQK